MNETRLTDVPVNQVIAMLLAAGKFTVPEIGRQTGVPLSRIYALRASPLFQQLVTEWATRFQEEAIDEVIKEIRDDALSNVRFLKDVRDAREDMDPKTMPFRMRASEMLFDRQLPKRADNGGGSAGPVVNIHIDSDRKSRIDVALAEDGESIDITDL